VNRIDIEQQVLTILNDKSFGLSGREISLAMPLGQEGLGLDSLALVGFITELENRFDIEIPETIWVEKRGLTLIDLIDLIADSKAGKTTQTEKTKSPPLIEHHMTLGEKWRTAAREKGFFASLIFVAGKLLIRIKKLIYHTDKLYILQFDLGSQEIPKFDRIEDLYLRRASAEDSDMILDFWPPSQREYKLGRFKKRLEEGYMCFIGITDNNIVAIDWVTDREDYEPMTGLNVNLQSGSCYGLDLSEHVRYKNRGYGLATLLYCMEATKEMGYKKHYTIVHAENEKMLLTSIQLIGYSKAGEINTRRIFNRPSSTWELHGTHGEGRILVL